MSASMLSGETGGEKRFTGTPWRSQRNLPKFHLTDEPTEDGGTIAQQRSMGNATTELESWALRRSTLITMNKQASL